MKFLAVEIAQIIEGKVEGDENSVVNELSEIENGDPVKGSPVFGINEYRRAYVQFKNIADLDSRVIK